MLNDDEYGFGSEPSWFIQTVLSHQAYNQVRYIKFLFSPWYSSICLRQK